MTIPQRLLDFAADLTAIRRDLHEHPELGFQEVRTAGIVAANLRACGIEVHEGIGKTGVVGLLHGNRPGRRIGLRADMDALPIHEQTNLPFASKTPGVMHACGHDAHTTMLLGAARYLAETRDFAGTAVFIFQPAEEGLGGGRAMIADGLFRRFPCDEIYGMHNSPYHPPGVIGVKPAVVIAASLVAQIQTIAARNVAPTSPAVVSVTQIHAGAAYNVIPEVATLAGTVRYFDRAVADLVTQRMQALCDGVARGYGVSVRLDMRNVFDVLENDPALSDAMIEQARALVGDKAALNPRISPTCCRSCPAPIARLDTRATSRSTTPGSCWMTTCCPWARR